MANLREIRRRIKSVRNTAQITRAMQMVAASKMKRAQVVAASGIAYADILHEVLTHVSQYLDALNGYKHALMIQRPVKTRVIVLIGTDRGLCGALNGNLFRECPPPDDSTVYVAVGRKAAQFVQRTKRPMLAEFPYSDPPKLSESRIVCRFLASLYHDEEVDAVDILFTNFITTFKQVPILWHFLPLGIPQDAQSWMPPTLKRKKPNLQPKDMGEFDFEPDPKIVYESLMNQTLDYQFLQIMREVRASEHSARMVAMKQATDNAEEMIRKLSLSYNKSRQAAITSELLDITSAVGANS